MSVSVLYGVNGGCWVALQSVAYSKNVLAFILGIVLLTKLELRCNGCRHSNHLMRTNMRVSSLSHQRRQWHPTPVLLPRKSHGQRSLVGLQSMGSLRVRHNWTTSLSLFTFHALEKEMATHSSVLAWRIPGTGEPGGLPSMGSQSRTWLKRLSSSSSSLSHTWQHKLWW